MQVWHVQAWTGVSVPAFMPLNVSEAEALQPDPSIVQSIVDSQAEVSQLSAQGPHVCGILLLVQARACKWLATGELAWLAHGL